MPVTTVTVTKVMPLTSVTEDGELYRRYADIEASIATVITKSVEQWASLAKATGAGRLASEVIVYLIKASQTLDTDVFGELVHILSQRMTAISAPFLRGFDRITKEELIETIQKKVIDLILRSPPSAQGDYMQIAFKNGVEQRTLNAIAKRKQFPRSLRHTPKSSLEGEEDEESLTDKIADDRPGPEELYLAQCDRAELLKLAKMAKTAVKDPRHYEAFVLHYVHGWEVGPKDEAAPSLVKRFKVSRRQIHTWLKTAREQMRAAIGGGK